MYMARKISQKNACFSFNVYEYGRNLGRINLKIVGRYNVYNALAVIAVARNYGISFNVIKKSIENFYGVKRRNEFLKKYNGKNVFTDYAHHPTEIREILKVYEEIGDALIIFQPHTYSRTKALMQDFVNVLNTKNTVVIYKTFAAREGFDEEGSAYNLFLKLKEIKKDVFYKEDEVSVKEFIKNNNSNNLLFLGAGDVYKIAEEL